MNKVSNHPWELSRVLWKWKLSQLRCVPRLLPTILLSIWPLGRKCVCVCVCGHHERYVFKWVCTVWRWLTSWNQRWVYMCEWEGQTVCLCILGISVRSGWTVFSLCKCGPWVWSMFVVKHKNFCVSVLMRWQCMCGLWVFSTDLKAVCLCVFVSPVFLEVSKYECRDVCVFSKYICVGDGQQHNNSPSC